MVGNRLSVVALLGAAGGLFVLFGAVALVLLSTAGRANERSTETEVGQGPTAHESLLYGTRPGRTMN